MLHDMVRPGIYEHFKGKKYRVWATGRHSETLEECVIYQALYDEQAWWVRPRSLFEEHIDREDYHGPRFRFVRDVATEFSQDP